MAAIFANAYNFVCDVELHIKDRNCEKTLTYLDVVEIVKSVGK